MNIQYPLHALTDAAFPSEREKNDPNDMHYAVFDSKHGCVAHVFDRDLAAIMAAAPEMAQALRIAIDALKANHQWHQDHDDYDGYQDSDLGEQNLKAIGAVEGAMGKAGVV